MKQTALVIAFFFLGLFAYTKLVGPIPFSVTSVTTQKTDTFTTTGEGKVFVKPDVATTTVGVQVNGTTVKQVQQDLNKKINDVSAAVKRVGVGDKDIQTINYWISPTYDYAAGTQRITGYTASSQLTIKARDIDKINDVIDAATATGANTVGGVSFDVNDKTASQNEAREMAVAEAKSKAEAAAKVAGFNLGKIVNYSENFGGWPGPIPMMAKAEGMAVDRAPTQVEPGSSQITVIVSLSFEIH